MVRLHMIRYLCRRLAPALQCPDVVGALPCARILRMLMAQAASSFGKGAHVVPLEPLFERMPHHADVRWTVMKERGDELHHIGAGQHRFDAVVRSRDAACQCQ